MSVVKFTPRKSDAESSRTACIDQLEEVLKRLRNGEAGEYGVTVVYCERAYGESDSFVQSYESWHGGVLANHAERLMALQISKDVLMDRVTSDG